jgi:hypothetical protein
MLVYHELNESGFVKKEDVGSQMSEAVVNSLLFLEY